MITLEAAVREVLGRIDRGPMNESNTKVLLIEPVLEALGWDTKDLDCVTREHRSTTEPFWTTPLSSKASPPCS